MQESVAPAPEDILSFYRKILPSATCSMDDDEFPADCTVLFQKHAEYYFDPESLAMISAILARSLTKAKPDRMDTSER